MSNSKIDEFASCRCLAARRISRVITRIYDARLREHGLKATQFSVLSVLALEGPLAIGKLADALGTERTTLTRSAAILQGRGWIAPDRSSDARERPLRLTNAGRLKLASAYSAWKAAQDYVGAKLGAPASDGA